MITNTQSGTNVQGRLETGDNRMNDGTWADVWTFQGTQGQRVVIELRSEEFDTYLQLLKRQGLDIRPRPQFAHAAVCRLPNGWTLMGCYHPSRQNTNTGKLTARMMDDVFKKVRKVL